MKEFLSLIKKWMTRLLAGIATVLLSIMTLLVLYQVFTRYILNSPAAFTEELVRYFLIWTASSELPMPSSPGSTCALYWYVTA